MADLSAHHLQGLSPVEPGLFMVRRCPEDAEGENLCVLGVSAVEIGLPRLRVPSFPPLLSPFPALAGEGEGAPGLTTAGAQGKSPRCRPGRNPALSLPPAGRGREGINSGKGRPGRRPPLPQGDIGSRSPHEKRRAYPSPWASITASFQYHSRSGEIGRRFTHGLTSR